MGKEGGRFVLVLLGTMRSFTNFYFGKDTTADWWGRTFMLPLLCWWLCWSSKPPKAQPPVTPSSGACRLWLLKVSRSLALCSAPRASCESLGAGVGGSSLSWSAQTAHLPGIVCHTSEPTGFTSCLKKALPPKRRCQRRQWCWRKRNSTSLVQTV